MEDSLEFRDFNFLKTFKFDDEKVSTITSREQVISIVHGLFVFCYLVVVVVFFIIYHNIFYF